MNERDYLTQGSAHTCASSADSVDNMERVSSSSLFSAPPPAPELARMGGFLALGGGGGGGGALGTPPFAGLPAPEAGLVPDSPSESILTAGREQCHRAAHGSPQAGLLQCRASLASCQTAITKANERLGRDNYAANP